MTDERPARRGSDADSRISRLEREMAERHAEARLLTSEMQHLRELMTTQFSTMNDSLLAVRTRIHDMATMLTTSLNDPASSAIGRGFNEDVTDLRARVNQLEAAGNSREQKIAQAIQTEQNLIGQVTSMAGTISNLKTDLDTAKGAASVARFVGFGGFVTALGALVWSIMARGAPA